MQLSYKKSVFVLIIISTVFRLFWASQLEFGNDEVYYWLYAKYPDISHFDHPAMVGFFIQFFTANLYFDSELTIRLASILPTSIAMYIVFLIGKYLKDDFVGFISVLLYNISIYGLIISGTFILPDAPMVLFWLLAFYFLMQVIPYQPKRENLLKLFLGFLCIGLAIYSKYQAVYLLFGVGLYVILFNRKWLKKWQFYVAFIFPILAVAIIYYWNYQNDFISYKFHNNRVSLFSLHFNKDSFLREIVGQIVYNNPYIFVAIILMMVAIIKKKFLFDQQKIYFFLLFTIPLIATTVYLSFSRDTLPHWSGVSYITLLPLLAMYVSSKKNIKRNLIRGFTFLVILLSFITLEINNGWILPFKPSKTKETLGRKDALMDLYGWQQAAKKVTEVLQENKLTSLPIISDNWYPAAHIDYYFARPNNMLVYGVGELPKIHKYFWINKKNPPLINNEVLYITDSRNYKNPKEIYDDKYNQFNLIETIPIFRNKETVKNVFIFRLIKD
ncbi:ArnT family glycosyltransferase [Polaribacter sargassicola]|uniref:ArnT family glycosyltransferase n=1 Tax=Polaribacter sargassicola TaxID=2836891 RepID=UPI001F1DE133|nr:glycosyltransferase family 39 protein [Polaribacter sp. DS7-9]MCG1036278.1 glycosyltransferase family 39 protein [Polaribacter sp. DS7-9]